VDEIIDNRLKDNISFVSRFFSILRAPTVISLVKSNEPSKFHFSIHLGSALMVMSSFDYYSVGGLPKVFLAVIRTTTS